MSPSILYLIRHATPDWNRSDIPYDIPPGPPLTPQGEREAAQLAAWLAGQDIRCLFSSPMLRARQTADIVAHHLQLLVQEAREAIEWQRQEPAAVVATRMQRFYERVRANGCNPAAVISHGGPIDLLLQALGVEETELAPLRQRFDHRNPLPPAGVWAVSDAGCSLVFTPGE